MVEVVVGVEVGVVVGVGVVVEVEVGVGVVVEVVVEVGVEVGVVVVMKIIRKGQRRLGKCKNQTTLLKKWEKIMKQIIVERDGNVCKVANYRHYCTPILVMDHRPSKRGNHSTFLDPRNLTTVCSNANWLAERDPFISHAIVEIVVAREGDIIEELHILSKKSKRWSDEECKEWVEKCREHFVKRINGKPE